MAHMRPYAESILRTALHSLLCISYWYKRYKMQQSGVDDNAGSFVELQVAKSSSAAPVEINFPGGIRIIFHEPVSSSYLKALIS